jgi:cytochrome c-type biogenesis protein CcmH
MRRVFLAVGLLLLWASAAMGQAVPPIITEDDVSRVAEKMYCPVCENIPLDDCGTATCVAWKNEIAQMLARGMSSEAIISDFVARYGEKVVGVPQDPVLRALSWAVPALAIVVAVVAALRLVRRWQQPADAPAAAESGAALPADASYRDRLERDLR